MDKWFEPIPLASRICLSALLGCLSGWLLLSFESDIRRGLTLNHIYDMFLGGLIFVPFALVLITPLLLVALALGVVFRRQIAERTFLWTIGSSFVTWVTTIGVLTFTGSKNEWEVTHSVAERLTHMITSADSMLVLAGAGGAGVSFYMLGMVRLGWGRTT